MDLNFNTDGKDLIESFSYPSSEFIFSTSIPSDFTNNVSGDGDLRPVLDLTSQSLTDFEASGDIPSADDPSTSL